MHSKSVVIQTYLQTMSIEEFVEVDINHYINFKNANKNI